MQVLFDSARCYKIGIAQLRNKAHHAGIATHRREEMNSSKQTEPTKSWFIWKELAMQREGLGADEINEELLYDDSFDVMSGDPICLTRSSIGGCKLVARVEADEFFDDDDDDEENAARIALDVARLIAAAPTMLAALKAAEFVMRTELTDPEDSGAYQAVVAAISAATQGPKT